MRTTICRPVPALLLTLALTLVGCLRSSDPRDDLYLLALLAIDLPETRSGLWLFPHNNDEPATDPTPAWHFSPYSSHQPKSYQVPHYEWSPAQTNSEIYYYRYRRDTGRVLAYYSDLGDNLVIAEIDTVSQTLRQLHIFAQLVEYAATGSITCQPTLGRCFIPAHYATPSSMMMNSIDIDSGVIERRIYTDQYKEISHLYYAEANNQLYLQQRDSGPPVVTSLLRFDAATLSMQQSFELPTGIFSTVTVHTQTLQLSTDGSRLYWILYHFTDDKNLLLQLDPLSLKLLADPVELPLALQDRWQEFLYLSSEDRWLAMAVYDPQQIFFLYSDGSIDTIYTAPVDPALVAVNGSLAYDPQLSLLALLQVNSADSFCQLHQALYEPGAAPRWITTSPIVECNLSLSGRSRFFEIVP